MRMTTIWTLRGMSLAERLRRTADATAMWLAARLPGRVSYWSFILQGARNMGDDAVPDARFMDVLSRIDGGPR